MLELYHSGLSTCSKQVRHCLREKGVPYKSHYIELWAYENLNPEYLKLNPNGVVPTLVHDGTAIINAPAINEYIDDAFDGPPLKPDDAKDRARMRHWVIMGDYMHQAIIDLTFTAQLKSMVDQLSEGDKAAMIARTPMPERRRRWENLAGKGIGQGELAAARERIDYVLDWMEKELAASGWLAGPRFSLADLYMLAHMHRMNELDPEQVGPSAYPRLSDWHARLKERPAVQFVYKPDTDEVPSRPPRKSIDGIFADSI